MFRGSIHLAGEPTMRTLTSLALLAVAAVPAVAQANCFSVYDGQNRLTYQSVVAPIDLSRRISDAMAARFPNSYLVMVPDESTCREVRAGGGVTQSRFGSIGGGTPNADKALASPLLRNTRTGLSSINEPSGVAPGANELPVREAVRGGNRLNIKREAPATRP